MKTDLQDLFHERGLRRTRQREDIYRALASTRAHPTADELHSMVRLADDHTISLPKTPALQHLANGQNGALAWPCRQA